LSLDVSHSTVLRAGLFDTVRDTEQKYRIINDQSGILLNQGTEFKMGLPGVVFIPGMQLNKDIQNSNEQTVLTFTSRKKLNNSKTKT